MNPRSLEALLLDRSFGELSPEASELLDAYLALHPEAQTDAAKIEETIAITEAAVTIRPELFSEAQLSKGLDDSEKIVPFSFPVWMRAAAAVAILSLVGAFGYIAGSQSAPSGEMKSSTPLASTTTQSPWAQYRITDSGIEASIPTPTPEP
ncbi:MAG: hypothetical protein CMO55_08305 [Verrucomicrobiales bacterium]|nr:hypothetical protein [Verrucomicrobiales bacterium]